MVSRFAPSPADPASRLEYARWSARQWKTLRPLTLTLLAAVIFLGTKIHGNFAVFDHITTQEIRLFQGQGKMSGTLVVRPEGTPTLQLLERGGKPRLLASLGPDGAPSFVFLDAREPDITEWTLEQYGQLSLFLLEQVGPIRAHVGRGPGGPRVFLGEGTATDRLTLGVVGSNSLERLTQEAKEQLLWSPSTHR
jgi:hypothetical protein